MPFFSYEKFLLSSKFLYEAGIFSPGTDGLSNVAKKEGKK